MDRRKLLFFLASSLAAGVAPVSAAKADEQWRLISEKIISPRHQRLDFPIPKHFGNLTKFRFVARGSSVWLYDIDASSGPHRHHLARIGRSILPDRPSPAIAILSNGIPIRRISVGFTHLPLTDASTRIELWAQL